MNTVANFITLLSLLILVSCNAGYDKSYYERISGIEIPESSSLIETYDNGEYLTVSSFKMLPSDVKDVGIKYHFEAVDGSYVPGFLGNAFLTGPKPGNSDLNKCLMKINQKGKAISVYVLDTSKQILWAEINYPDMAGN